MRILSSTESRVKTLVDQFFGDKITVEQFKRELARTIFRRRPKKQRRLPKAGGRTYS
jgi:hypothetical protein